MPPPSPASVRLDFAAASSFYTFLERRSDGRVANPFRGSKARPAPKARRAAAYPSEKDATLILAALAPEDRAAAAVMLYHGLRVGALPSLTLHAGRFMARSKGKDISGELPAEPIAAVKAAGLDRPTAVRRVDGDEDSRRNQPEDKEVSRKRRASRCLFRPGLPALLRREGIPQGYRHLPHIKASRPCIDSHHRTMPKRPRGSGLGAVP
jgi:hypothetical protein